MINVAKSLVPRVVAALSLWALASTASHGAGVPAVSYPPPGGVTFSSSGTAGSGTGRTGFYSGFNSAAYHKLFFTYTVIPNPRHSSQAATGSMQFSSYDSTTGIATWTSTANAQWATASGSESVATRLRVQFQPYTGTHSGVASTGLATAQASAAPIDTLPSASWPVLDVAALPNPNQFQVWARFETSSGTPILDYYNGTNSTGGNFVTATTGGFFADQPPTAVADTLISNGGTASVQIDPRANDTDPDDQADLTVTAVTQGTKGSVLFGPAFVAYTPGADYFGTDSFTYTIADGFGATATATVTVKATAPIVISGIAKGGEVTDHPGDTFTTLGPPAPGAFSGVFKSGNVKTTSIFGPDGKVRVSVGGEAPTLAGSVISKLGKPSGQAALASLKANVGGVTAADNDVLLAGLTDGPVRIAARENGPTNLADITIKSFGSIDGNGSVIFFLAKLQGIEVIAKNANALCAALPDGTVRVLVRTDDGFGALKVKTLGTLVAVKGALGEGRWRAGEDAIGVRITFDDQSQSLYTFTAAATTTSKLWAASGDVLTAPLADAKIASLGLPGFGPGGVAFVAKLAVDLGGVTKPDSIALFETHDANLNLIARTAGAVPDASGGTISDATFKTISNPVAGADGKLAFAGAITGTGVPKKTNLGIWWGKAGAIKLLARQGDTAEGGGKWLTFSSLAFPNGVGSGPLLAGKVATDAVAGIDATNNVRLWGVNSAGSLQLLLSAGQKVSFSSGLKTLKSFSAFAPAAGALGAASGFDNAGHVTVLGTFTDGTVAYVKIAIP